MCKTIIKNSKIGLSKISLTYSMIKEYSKFALN